MPDTQELPRRRHPTLTALDTVARVLGALIWLIVAILVLHGLLVLFGANPTNRFATFVHGWADTLSLGLGDLFTVPSPAQATAASFGLAALIWLVIRAVVLGLLRRVAQPWPGTPARSNLLAGHALSWLGSAVTLVSRLIALLLALHIVFVAGQANPANVWTPVVSTWAARLDLGLGHLFTLPDARTTTLVNYGIAAIIWLVIGRLVSLLIRRAGRA